MTILYWLDRIQPSQRVIVGEKAFLLNRLIQEGYPIFPGFVVNTTTFETFLESLEDSQSLLADYPHSSLYVDVDNPKALQLVAKNSRQAILQTPLPSDWLKTLVDAAQQLETTALIFRLSLSLPSAKLPQLAGLLSSQVSWNQPQAIELGLKQAWSELFKARSLFYWQRLGIPLQKVNVAILVQPLEDAITTGRIFLQPDSWQLQATWGIGYSLLKGHVSPDIYEIAPLTGRIERKQLGIKPCAYQIRPVGSSHELKCLDLYLLSTEKSENYCLDDDVVNQLFQLIQRLSLANSSLKSVEWCLTSNFQLYLLKGQMNSLASVSQKSTLANPSALRGLGASPGVVNALLQIIPQLSSISGRNLAGSILVTHEITPAWLPLLKQAVGVILERGGMTSHGAIIARELGIPAVVGVSKATQLFASGESVSLDGTTGEIYRGRQPQLPLMSHSTPTNSDVAPTNYPIATQLMVNITQVSSISKTVDLPVDGVGLLRSEWLLSELLLIHPWEIWLESSFQQQFIEELSNLILPFVQAFHPLPVFYRSFDGLVPGEGQTSLGKRGTYSYLLNPTLFALEVQAIKQLQDRGYYNIKLILPFIRSVEEFRFCQQRIIQAGLTQSPSFEVWIMAEVPSVLFLLPEYVRAGVQGIAIGTNDLTQLLLGIDREDPQLSQHYNACHPAMLMALKQLIQQARALGIPCSICGQATVQYPALIESLIEWGITAISVAPESIPQVYQAIARVEYNFYLEVARKNRNQTDYHTGSE